MDFEFSEAERAFAQEVESFLDAEETPEVMDVTRENMAQIVDTPKRRELMKKIGEQGWLGMTWPADYDGQEGEGVYEYLLNEELAGRGGPQILDVGRATLTVTEFASLHTGRDQTAVRGFARVEVSAILDHVVAGQVGDMARRAHGRVR